MEMKRELKKLRSFKLHPKIDASLRKEALRTNRTQTAIVEMALRNFLARAA